MRRRCSKTPPLRQPRNGRWKATGSSWRNIIITTITIITIGHSGGVTTIITTTTITTIIDARSMTTAKALVISMDRSPYPEPWRPAA